MRVQLQELKGLKVIRELKVFKDPRILLLELKETKVLKVPI
jgi:hypothetical protein